MAGFTDTLRGDGLARAQRALAGLEGDPLRLKAARKRFIRPPQYTSDRSGTTTRSASPEPPSERERRERRVQLGLDREASYPYEQYQAQTIEEEKRLWEADRKGTRRLRVGDTPSKIADEIVKSRWVEQGIWNNKWNAFADGKWKHEEPLELESEFETDTEALNSLFSLSQPKPRRPKSDEEKRRMAERRAVQEREREASRPFFQFVYQISKERERILDESKGEEGAGAADINSRASESVKAIWITRGIWNRKWGTIPGMSWKHEEPLEEEAADNPAPVRANPLVNGGHEAGEVSTRRIFGPPYFHASIKNTSQEKPSTSIDSAGLENGDAECSPFASNSPHPRTGKRVLRPMTKQALQRSRKKPPHKGGQSQPMASASLGPVHSSKVFKAAGKRKPSSQRGQNTSQKVSSDSMPLSSSVDAAEERPSLDIVTLRRSNRINLPKSERNAVSSLATKSSGKPQGISKRHTTKTTPRKARNQ